MKAQIQLIVSTLALTVLIWMYADQAGHETYTTTVMVKYTAPSQPGANKTVLRVVGSPSEGSDLVRTELTVRGPRSAIRRLEKDDAAGRFTLTVVVADELGSGLQPSRSLFDDLGRLPEIRNRGVSLQRVIPAGVQIEADRIKSVAVDVEVVAGVFEKTLVGKPVVRPEKVEAHILESTLEKFGPLPPLRISMEDELQARAEQSGGTFSFDLPLRSTWPGVAATFAPEQVRVTARFVRRTIRERVTLIPLSVLVKPQDAFTRYSIDWQDETGGHFMQAIDVRVPLDKAGQLKGNMIDAYVTIEDADLPKDLPGLATTGPASSESWIEREIHFVFPPGFEDVKMEGPPKTVKFRVHRKPDQARAASPVLAPTPSR